MPVQPNLAHHCWHSLAPASIGDGNLAAFTLPPTTTGRGLYRIMAR
jgi:hypothetical protein